MMTLPDVIHTEAENEHWTAVLTTLVLKDNRTAEEDRQTKLLISLIEDFEEREYGHPV